MSLAPTVVLPDASRLRPETPAVEVKPPRGAAGPTVAMITEGTYPFRHGGVSTWCDQLISSMPESTFEVVSIVARGGNRSVWELPPNIAGVTELGFWEPRVPGERPRYLRAAGRSRLDPAAFEAVCLLFELLTDPDPDTDVERFDRCLDALIGNSEARLLAPALRCRAAFDALTDLCRSDGVPISMSEVIQCLELLEHFLRPAGLDLPEADIYHATGNGLAALVGIAAAQRTGSPLVMSEHGVYLRERYLEYRTGELGPSAKRILLRFHRLLAVAAYRRADLIVPVTRYNKRWELHNGADPSRIRVVNNGVDPARFGHRLPEPERPPTVGFLSRIDRVKDPLTLIHAVAQLQKRIPELSVRMWGEVAEGQEDYDQECRDTVRRLGLDQLISFEGHTEDPAAACRAVDVLVSSSVSEGLPYGIIEAMMGATPIVSTNVGGLPEALDGVGLLVEPGNPEQLADAVESLLWAPRRAAHFGWAARRRALQRFTLSGMVEQYRSIYDELCPSIDIRDEAPDAPRPVEAQR